MKLPQDWQLSWPGLLVMFLALGPLIYGVLANSWGWGWGDTGLLLLGAGAFLAWFLYSGPIDPP